MKKWLSILLALSLAFTNVYAQDDDDDEEEEAPKKKTAPKKKDSGESRIGLAVGFDGNSGLISLVYDMGSGMELGLGLGLYRKQYTPAQGDAPEPDQRIEIVPNISYGLGNGLLNYGVGLSLGVIMEPNGGKSLYGYPNFYTGAELVKNVLLRLSAGFRVDMPAEYDDGGKDMMINAVARGTIIFYFM